MPGCTGELHSQSATPTTHGCWPGYRPGKKAFGKKVLLLILFVCLWRTLDPVRNCTCAVQEHTLLDIQTLGSQPLTLSLPNRANTCTLGAQAQCQRQRWRSQSRKRKKANGIGGLIRRAPGYWLPYPMP
eukprot:1401085-Amphidinium_carterae.1